MKHKLTFILLLLVATALAQDSKNHVMIDSSASSNSLLFDKEIYSMVWLHSDTNYCKQEYIRSKDTLKSFNKMITIDLLRKNIIPKDLVAMKIKEIEDRKGKDPLANYQVIENEQNEEFLLDFLISEGDLYEWNAYRYKIINTNKGKAILLFAFTFRSFEGAELNLNNFFPYLKKNRTKLIEKVATYTLPVIKLID